MNKEIYENNEGYMNIVMSTASALLKKIKHISNEDGYKEITRLVTSAVSSNKFKEKTTCGSIGNCSFCCHSKIILGPVEAIFIKEYVISNNIPFNKERIEKQLSGNSLSWADMACPLLRDANEAGNRLCSIYENRPLVCRIHNSTEDPLGCDRSELPERVVRELMSPEIDGMNFSSYLIGSKDGTPVMTSVAEIFRD